MATKLYNELKDMDFSDYEESTEEDLDFINELIEEKGYSTAKEILMEMVEQ